MTYPSRSATWGLAINSKPNRVAEHLLDQDEGASLDGVRVDVAQQAKALLVPR